MKRFPFNASLRGLLALSAVGLVALVACAPAAAQADKQLVRLAKLDIYPAELERYRVALKAHIETALRVEPGVLTLYAVAEKANPAHITILEIYASEAAYQAHLKTPHFLTYKTGTLHMVKSLELVETEPLLPNVSVKSHRP